MLKAYPMYPSCFNVKQQALKGHTKLFFVQNAQNMKICLILTFPSTFGMLQNISGHLAPKLSKI